MLEDCYFDVFHLNEEASFTCYKDCSQYIHSELMNSIHLFRKFVGKTAASRLLADTSGVQGGEVSDGGGGKE
jgi:hypothetical protein